MTGLIYKEYKQNRILLLLTAAAAFAGIILPITLTAQIMGTGIKEILLRQEEQLINGIKLISLLVAYLASGFMQGLIFRSDNRRIYSEFIASTPDGIKGYMRIKYELTFMMSMLMLISCNIFDNLLALISQITTGDCYSCSGVVMILFYVQLLLRSLEIPFTVRFGIKQGSIIKSIIMIVLMLILTVVVLTDPSGIMTHIADCIAGNDEILITGTPKLLIGIFPVVSFMSFCLSYKVSCRLYMKGAQRNEI